ncbi:MAG: SPOR domain-containing protein, partial [Saprospiraceae bacterium]
ILVTIFILLLLYIWISHVWGPDNPRHPQQIVDATQSEHTLGADDPSTDIDTFLNTSPDPMGNGTATKSEVTSENKTQEVTEQVKSEPVNTEPEKTEPKKPETVKPETVKTQSVKKEAAPEKKPVAKTETKSKAVATQTAPAPKTTQAVAKKTSLPNTEGKHLVIAGNFLQMVNAEQRMAELKKAGFKDVEILNFDLSEYHTVCAGRFTDVNEARRLVKKLKDYHKIDAYVRVGN